MLAPSYIGRLQPNQPHGELVVDEVPGLNLALARDGTPITVEVTLTSGHTVTTTLMLPDVVSAICLKAYAYAGRLTARDAVDLWRLLEAAYAAGITADIWPTGPTATEAATVLRQHFGRPGASGLRRTGGSMRDRTHISALVTHVVGPP